MQKNRLAVVRRTGAFSLVALGRRWVAVSVALALAGAGVVVVTPVAEAAPPIPVDCSTMNLQTAMNEASPGATLAISGICVGHFTIDGKALTLVRNGNTATLDGGQTGTVLTITDGADVTLDQLTITHGATADAGGGIYNGGTLTLNAGSSVIGNSAEFHGGGIYNFGILTGAVDGRDVRDNTPDNIFPPEG